MISFTFQNQVMSGVALPSTAKAVYMQLLARADQYRKCFPSIETLASDVGRSARTIQRALRVLCEHQLVKKEARYRLNSSQTSNQYILLDPPQLASRRARKSYESKTTLIAGQQADDKAVFFYNEVEIETAPPCAKEQKKRKSGACVTPHAPQAAAQSSKTNLVFTIPPMLSVCQVKNKNNQKISEKLRMAIQFARLFAFSGIRFKEAAQMMEIAELYGIMKHQALSNTAKLVFICMASAADGEGRCVAYPEKLAKQLRKSKRTIQRALAALEKGQLIHMESEGAGTGPFFYRVFPQKCHPTG